MNIKLIYALASRSGNYYRVNGRLILKNLCYHKQVNVHHNSSNSWTDSQCNFQRSLSNDNEQWNFNLNIYAPVGPYLSSQRTQFALKYEPLQPYQIFWDNNSNRDYFVGVEGRSAGWEFPDLALGNPILLMKASFKNNKFQGCLAVKNIIFEKKISVRYTIDDWSTYSDIQANFSYDYNPNDIQVYEGEVWEFETPIPSGVNHIIFAIRYEFMDQIYWDNNQQNDYYLNKNSTVGIL